MNPFAFVPKTTINFSVENPSEENQGMCKGLSTREAGRGHATPHMPAETAKCWWLLKIEPNAWEGGKGSCAVCVDFQAVGTLEFFGELYSGTGLESKVCVRATIGLFECISEPNFRSPFAYVCSEPGVSFNTPMWMDHTNKP